MFRTLPNIYNGAFYKEPCVTIANLDAQYIQIFPLLRTRVSQLLLNVSAIL